MIVRTLCNNCDAVCGTMDTRTDYRATSFQRPVDAKPEDLVFHLTNMTECPDGCGNACVTIHISAAE